MQKAKNTGYKAAFQFLIGRVKMPKLSRKMEVKSKFQFLIGRVKIFKPTKNKRA